VPCCAKHGGVDVVERDEGSGGNGDDGGELAIHGCAFRIPSPSHFHTPPLSFRHSTSQAAPAPQK
jgi:hypothetical protein